MNLSRSKTMNRLLDTYMQSMESINEQREELAMKEMKLIKREAEVFNEFRQNILVLRKLIAENRLDDD